MNVTFLFLIFKLVCLQTGSRHFSTNNLDAIYLFTEEQLILRPIFPSFLFFLTAPKLN